MTREIVKISRAKAESATPHANLVRYDPAKTYFARIRVSGKLIRQSLRTKVQSVARLRLTDLEKVERQAAGSASAAKSGKMAFADALRIYRERLHGNGALKSRTKQYEEECISELLRTWPELQPLDIRQVTKTRCLNWAAKLGKDVCPSVFNHTIATLRRVLEVAIAMRGTLRQSVLRRKK